MEELRCPNCNKLLGKADLMAGSRVEIACRNQKCKKTKKNVVQFFARPSEETTEED